VALVLGGAAPCLYVRRKKAKRILRLESQLPDAIDLIARAVRAGHPLSEGLRMAAEEASEPLASEFRVTFEEQKFGLPFEEALLGLGDRVEVVDIRILITAILVQREVGGNLSEILEQIAETMRARFNLKRQVRVYTAQGRMSGYTLAALPILVGLVVTLINPDYMQTLYREDLGRALLIGAATLQGIGFLWIRQIVDVRY
jgi:tight adherence protein B